MNVQGKAEPGRKALISFALGSKEPSSVRWISMPKYRVGNLSAVIANFSV